MGMTWVVKWLECRECKSMIIVSQPTERLADYWYYCSLKTCTNHTGEQIGDQEEPTFAFRKEREL